MTTDKTYRCNLCHGSIADKFRGDGVGIYYIGNKIEFRDVRAAENHICKACLKAISELLPLSIEATQ